MRIQKIIISIVMVAFIFTGCSKKILALEGIANHVDIVEESEYGKIKMEFLKLDGEVRG